MRYQARALGWFIVVALAYLTYASPAWPQGTAAMLEIRVYTLKPGVRDQFHADFLAESLPLLRRAGVDVVAFGPSRHGQDSYYLMRAFPSVEARERRSEERRVGKEYGSR